MPPMLTDLSELTPDQAARVAAAVAIVGLRVNPPDLAAALGIPAALFEEALALGEAEIARLAADPAAAPREDLGPAVTLARGIRAAADWWAPPAALALYEAGEAGDLDARGILERHTGTAWSAIVEAVEGTAPASTE